MSRRKANYYYQSNHASDRDSRNWHSKDWKKHCMSKCLSRSCLCCIGVTILLVWLTFEMYFVARNVFPETELVLNSKCRNPVRNWDGKLFNFQVWDTSFYFERPSYYNVHREHEYEGNDSNHHVAPLQIIPRAIGAGTPERPVVIWGTHHKTGTFLAKKLFAKVCGVMKWCCLFHVTRDSVHAIKDGLLTEPVDGFGHNQWIWNPDALGISNYLFIHFYRHPYRKILSGYRYHSDGTETWTQKPMQFDYLCRSPLLLREDDRENGGQGGASLAQSKSGGHLHRSNASMRAAMSMAWPQQAGLTLSDRVDRESVWEFCAAMHLCETCCRMEHERVWLAASAKHQYQHQHQHQQAVPSSKQPGAGVNYFRRPRYEYEFMCKYLGAGSNGTSLQDLLTKQPAELGIVAEAALDYYENLRMARIINHTTSTHDARTLHIDLDELSRDFGGQLWRMLHHLAEGGALPEKMLPQLHEELLFYDLQTSPFYRWSMTNPIINHVTSSTLKQQQPQQQQQQQPEKSLSLKGYATLTPNVADGKARSPSVDSSPSGNAHGNGHGNGHGARSSEELLSILENSPEVARMYKPVLDYMNSVLVPTTPQASDQNLGGVSP